MYNNHSGNRSLETQFPKEWVVKSIEKKIYENSIHTIIIYCFREGRENALLPTSHWFNKHDFLSESQRMGCHSVIKGFLGYIKVRV